MTKVLCIAAHPDDEVLGPGGTLALHATHGDEVGLLILGEGPISRGGDQKRAIDSARTGLEKSSEALGISWWDVLGLPDQRFDTVPFLEIVQSIESIRDRRPPEVVYCHWRGDLNLDHSIAARAALTAFRPVPGAAWLRILAFHTPSSTDWSGPSDAFNPNVFVDVSATMEAKMRALSAYSSEMRDPPHQRSIEGVRSLAACFGNRVGLNAAEAFMLMREVNR